MDITKEMTKDKTIYHLSQIYSAVQEPVLDFIILVATYRLFLTSKTTLSYKQVRNNNAINSNQPLLINIRIKEPRLRVLFQPPTTTTINGKARLKGVGACAPTIKLKGKVCM